METLLSLVSSAATGAAATTAGQRASGRLSSLTRGRVRDGAALNEPAAGPGPRDAPASTSYSDESDLDQPEEVLSFVEKVESKKVRHSRRGGRLPACWN